MKTKELIVKDAAIALGIPVSTVGPIFDAIFGSMATALTSGEGVQLRGFGSFNAKRRAARPGRNPRTGATIELPERATIGFTPSRALRQALNPDIELSQARGKPVTTSPYITKSDNLAITNSVSKWRL